MGKKVTAFILAFLVAFGGGYLYFTSTSADSVSEDPIPAETEANDSAEQEAEVTEETDASQEDRAENNGGENAGGEVESVSAEADVLDQAGCLACHAVDSLNVDGGTTGPDISDAYASVEGKHGKPLKEFLQEPTSAVMSDVIGDDPLSDEEIEAIVDVLEDAAQQ